MKIPPPPLLPLTMYASDIRRCNAYRKEEREGEIRKEPDHQDNLPMPQVTCYKSMIIYLNYYKCVVIKFSLMKALLGVEIEFCNITKH